METGYTRSQPARWKFGKTKFASATRRDHASGHTNYVGARERKVTGVHRVLFQCPASMRCTSSEADSPSDTFSRKRHTQTRSQELAEVTGQAIPQRAAATDKA